MSKIDFGQIADHVRELDHALHAAQSQVAALWLAGRGAASLVPHESGALVEMLSNLFVRYEDGLPKAREIQQKLAMLVKDATAP